MGNGAQRGISLSLVIGFVAPLCIVVAPDSPVVPIAAAVPRGTIDDNIHDNIDVSGPMPAAPACATITDTDVTAAAVVGDLIKGRSIVYVDLIGYDEVSHHSGISRPETLAVLTKLDEIVEMLLAVTERLRLEFGERDRLFVVAGDLDELLAAERGEADVLDDVIGLVEHGGHDCSPASEVNVPQFSYGSARAPSRSTPEAQMKHKDIFI